MSEAGRQVLSSYLDAVACHHGLWEIRQAVVRRIELLEWCRLDLEGGGEEQGRGEGRQVVLGQIEHLKDDAVGRGRDGVGGSGAGRNMDRKKE